MLRHENACTALPPNLRGLLATPRIFQEEIPIRFAERIRWIEQVGQVRYHQIQHVFSVFFGGGNNIRHAKSQVCLEFGSHRQFRRCETEHVSEADLNLIGAAGIS